MKRYTLLITLLAAVVPLWSQIPTCGNELQQFSDAFLKNLPDLSSRVFSPIPKRGEPDTIALTIHIVETQGSDSKKMVELIEQEIMAVNEIFFSAGLFFQSCGPIRTIKGAWAYNFETSEGLNEQNHVPNTINIYFSNWLQNEYGVPLCGFASFPWTKRPIDRFVMMSKECLDGGVTLAHEFGHFYGLYHTHETYFGAEFVNGSNCKFAGDKICDTPADPNLGRGFISSDCSYLGTQKDARGEPYAPQVSNIMSYAPTKCRWQFSPQQGSLMQSVHEKENAYLYRNCDFYPDFMITADALPDITIRSGNPIPVAYTFSNIGITKDYELDLRFSISTAADQEGTIIHWETLQIGPEQSSLTRNFSIDFPENRSSGQYFLVAKVDAYNEFVERREENNAVAIPIVVDNSSLGDVVAFPNPTADYLYFFLRDIEKKGRMHLRIFRHDGRLIRELPEVYKVDGEILTRIPVADLAPGLYLLSVLLNNEDRPYTFSFVKN